MCQHAHTSALCQVQRSSAELSLCGRVDRGGDGRRPARDRGRQRPASQPATHRAHGTAGVRGHWHGGPVQELYTSRGSAPRRKVVMGRHTTRSSAPFLGCLAHGHQAHSGLTATAGITRLMTVAQEAASALREVYSSCTAPAMPMTTYSGCPMRSGPRIGRDPWVVPVCREAGP